MTQDEGAKKTRATIPYVSSAPEAGFDEADLTRAYGVLDHFSREEGVCGGVAFIGRSDRVLPPRSFGLKALCPTEEENDSATIYDCASLTKPIVTTTLLLALIDRGKVRLDDPAHHYLSRFGKGSFFNDDFPQGKGRHRMQTAGYQRTLPLSDAKARITLRHLLTHTSGLPAWSPLYELGEGWDDIVLAACQTPLERRPGEKVVYSCIGFILLGEIIRRVTDRPFHQLAHEWIFQRIGMETACFNPPESWVDQIAPTEVTNEPWDEGEPIRGVVHDENARAMGGVSGNAGLFASAEDIGLFALALLGRGTIGDRRLFSEAAYRLAVRNQTEKYNVPRGLGWDLKGRQYSSSAGDYMNPDSFGHTGFTGTSLWIDPVRDLFVVLLTNRVHPTRDNDAHLRMRPLFHNTVIAALRD